MNRDRALLIVILACILFMVVIGNLPKYSKREIKIIQFAYQSTENFRLNPDTIIAEQANRAVLHAPYIAIFLSDNDRLQWGSNSDLIYMNRLKRYESPDSIKTIFYISCPIAENRKYNSKTVKRKGITTNSTNTQTNLSTCFVNIWVYNCETKKIVAFKKFTPPPLEDSYINEHPREVSWADVHQYIKSFIIMKE